MTEAAQLDESTASEARLQYLHEVLESGRMRRLKPLLHSLHPAETALLLEGVPRTKRMLVWGLVPDDDHGEVLLHVNDEVRSQLIEGLDDDVLLAAADGLEMDDLADLLEDLPETVTQQVLRSMDQQNRERLESVLSYPADSAGGLMNTDTVTVRPDVSLDVVTRYLHQRAQLPDQTDTLFVVSRYGRYLGMLSLARLVTLDPERDVSEVMDTSVEGLLVDMPASQVAKRFQDLDLISAPVVDENERLVGRITIDDVVDVIRDEAEHSIMSMAGLDEEEDVFAPIARSARRRAVWLGINLFTASLAAQVVGLFEATLSEVVALAVLMPIVASMGGIGGSQTLTIMIRGLAMGQIAFSNARTLFFKELAVAMINGVIWGLVVGLVAYIWFGNITLGVVIGTALVFNQIGAAVAGVGLPLLMRKMGIDPALAGTVVLTTITDIVGFGLFLGMGTLLLL
ncbi:magnesium transporter [Spectribacter hydrogenoxidans]|uniref:Magnesium transporter MgtE n=1 Tax=Spectribacter hydrogenoxidans TaxID=3075608 RepID=A0ABU3BX45_9GAMM|nr:magnesium transporter [Salinisphaera sp. W335]MDT0633835.1 magnesium transporter [Salinisphaera sp. W335]